MELADIRPIVEFYHSKLSQVSLDFKRYLYTQINWDSSVIGIMGERGVGKTTMLLQRIKEKYVNPDDTFYISLDHYWFGTHELQDLIKFMYKRGITEFYIDEVHKYKGWSGILKTLVDELHDLRIVYTGSSLLEIDNAKVDMSRRQTPYTLKGMSFREYLEYDGILKMNAVTRTPMWGFLVHRVIRGCKAPWKRNSSHTPASTASTSMLEIRSQVLRLLVSISRIWLAASSMSRMNSATAPSWGMMNILNVDNTLTTGSSVMDRSNTMLTMDVFGRRLAAL